MKTRLFFIGLAGCLALWTISETARADDFAYVALSNADFATLDLTTGTVSVLGNSGGGLTAGLGVYNGILYGEGGGTGNLEIVNPANGALTFVGNAGGGVGFTAFGSTLNGLFGWNGDLYSINPTNGAATDIGPAPAACCGTDMSTNSNTLYLTRGGNFYTVNTSTGATTLVGSPGVGAMVMENGTLYAESNNGAQVDTVNPSTGVATAGPAIQGAPEVFGFAPDPLPEAPVPEPATWGAGVLLVVGLLLHLFRRRRATV